MNYHYLSKKEIAKIEDTVKILFQKKNAGLDFKYEYEYVKDKTEFLFFLIPFRSFYIQRELCSEFYLFMLPKVDQIINSYRISSNVPYLAYLHMVLRTRSKTFIVQKQKREKKENQFITSFIQYETSLDVFEPEALYLAKPNSEIEEYTLAESNYSLLEIVDTIVTSTPLPVDSDIDINEKLISFLLDQHNRKKFLVFIINNFFSLTDDEIKVLSSIMNVSPNIIAELSLKLHDINETKINKINDSYNKIINKYWKRYLIIIDTLSQDSLDKKERKELETQKNLVLSRIRVKQECKSNNVHVGTPLQVIAHELNRSPTCVSGWNKEVKDLLTQIQIEEEEDFLFD